MSKKPFQQFIQKGESGAKKKERIRQEKKQVRKETNEYFEQKKREKKTGIIVSAPTDRGDRSKSRPAPGRSPGNKSQENRYKPEGNNRRTDIKDKTQTGNKPGLIKKDKPAVQVKTRNSSTASAKATAVKGESFNQMPLNKFVAHSGICSRRDAADMVKSGSVTVDGKTITEPGFKVSGKEDIRMNGKPITIRRNFVYILLNKPKDFITTTDDPEGRKTVFDIIKHATAERVYPIGRLDRNTTGVLLFTNDGELTQKLSHPSYEVKKIYEVKLDKPLTKKDFETLINGITLEDGFIAPDVLAYADPKDKSVIGIEIHSGRNRIVRRIFENLGYDVRNLDRVMYANLTKKNVERGKWRFLSEKEVRLLKYMNASYKKNKPAARG
jgi:23S rRNA pseudouridine2605 synthase